MSRLDADEFRALQERMSSVGIKSRRAQKESSSRRNKFGAVKTEYQGIKFDSKAECRRYIQLRTMERAGEISELRIQVAYELFPAQVVDGKRIRACRYIADFEYLDRNGVLVTEDVKSGPTKTAEFRVKAKAFAFRYGRAIREVLMD